MHVLIIGHGRDMPHHLAELDDSVTISVLCETAATVKVRESHRIARVLGVRSAQQRDEWLMLAKGVHQIDQIDVVCAFGEWHQDIAADSGTLLGVRAHAPSTVRNVHDKSTVRAELARCGVDVVPAAVVHSGTEVAKFIVQTKAPCIVKPVDGVASQGISLVQDPAEAAEAFDRAVRAGVAPNATAVLVERYLEGPQFSVEMLSGNGECHPVSMSRKYSDATTFVELGHVAPAPISPQLRDEIVEFCAAVAAALGVTRGATHTEVVVTPDGPHVIETHLRLGGDDIARLVEHSTSVVLEAELAREALGRDSSDTVLSGPRAAQASAIWFVPSTARGTLREVLGLAEAREAEGVVSVDVLLDQGSALRELASSRDRVASVRAVGPDPATAVRRAQDAAALLTVVAELTTDPANWAFV